MLSSLTLFLSYGEFIYCLPKMRCQNARALPLGSLYLFFTETLMGNMTIADEYSQDFGQTMLRRVHNVTDRMAM